MNANGAGATFLTDLGPRRPGGLFILSSGRGELGQGRWLWVGGISVCNPDVASAASMRLAAVRLAAAIGRLTRRKRHPGPIRRPDGRETIGAGGGELGQGHWIGVGGISVH